jgi:hypothetical protein
MVSFLKKKKMFRRLVERASVEDHVYVLRVLILERVELATAALKDRRDVVDDHGYILCEDRVLGPFFPLVATIVHTFERTRIGVETSPDLPLQVDIVGPLRRLYEFGQGLPKGVRDARAVRMMRMVQWLLLVWVRLDSEAKVAAFGKEGPSREWWHVVRMVHYAWRVRGRVEWTATPTTRGVIIEPRRWKSTTLMELLAHRYCLMCC